MIDSIGALPAGDCATTGTCWAVVCHCCPPAIGPIPDGGTLRLGSTGPMQNWSQLPPPTPAALLCRLTSVVETVPLTPEPDTAKHET